MTISINADLHERSLGAFNEESRTGRAAASIEGGGRVNSAVSWTSMGLAKTPSALCTYSTLAITGLRMPII